MRLKRFKRKEINHFSSSIKALIQKLKPYHSTRGIEEVIKLKRESLNKRRNSGFKKVFIDPLVDNGEFREHFSTKELQRESG